MDKAYQCSNGLVLVKFLTRYRSYNMADVAGFDPKQAAELTRGSNPIATYHTPTKEEVELKEVRRGLRRRNRINMLAERQRISTEEAEKELLKLEAQKKKANELSQKKRDEQAANKKK